VWFDGKAKQLRTLSREREFNIKKKFKKNKYHLSGHFSFENFLFFASFPLATFDGPSSGERGKMQCFVNQ
jgi:hypothetical protein